MAKRSVTITLPLPSPKLSPNGRQHWRSLAAAKKAAREDAHYAAIEAAHKTKGFGKAEIQPVFYFRDKRKRDDDNLTASLKAYRDGLADAGLVKDDHDFHSLRPIQHIDREDPRLELIITETEAKSV